MKIIKCFILLSVFLVECRKDQFDGTGKLLEGNWKWHHSKYPYGYNIYTAYPTEATKLRLHFFHKRWLKMINGVESEEDVKKERVTIDIKEEGNGIFSVYIMVHEGRKDGRYYSGKLYDRDNDSLVLYQVPMNDPYWGTTLNYFVRE